MLMDKSNNPDPNLSSSVQTMYLPNPNLSSSVQPKPKQS